VAVVRLAPVDGHEIDTEKLGGAGVLGDDAGGVVHGGGG